MSQPNWPSECHGLVTFTVTVPPCAQGSLLYLPLPLSDAHQLVGTQRFSHAAAVHSDRKYRTPALHWALGPSDTPVVLEWAFQVQRAACARPPGLAEAATRAGAPMDEAAFVLDLETPSRATADTVKLRAQLITHGISATAPFAKARALLQGASTAPPYAKARAIYDWICDYMARDPNCAGCGDGDVCVLLDKMSGKCTDIHSVFVALCRAVGIPAREVFGLRLGKARDAATDVTQWQHCWVEWFLPSFGWLVCDPSDVLKEALSGKVEKGTEQFAQLKDKFWCQVMDRLIVERSHGAQLDPFRVAVSVGRDVELQPIIAGQRLVVNTFNYPVLVVDGQVQPALGPFYKIVFQP